MSYESAKGHSGCAWLVCVRQRLKSKKTSRTTELVLKKQESTAVRVSAKIKVSDKSGAIPDLSTTARKRAAGLIKV